MEFFIAIMSPFVSAIIASLATILISRAAGFLGDQRSENAAIKEGLRTLLRNELIQAHRDYVDRGFVTLEILEYCEQTYNAYHGLGGNGSGDKLWEDIKKLPIKG